MSQRSLQRRLKEHGVIFKTLVDDTRRRFALNYLKDRKHTLTEIAFLLGYSEVSAFNRAFKRWTSSTHLDYRRSMGEVNMNLKKTDLCRFELLSANIPSACWCVNTKETLPRIKTT